MAAKEPAAGRLTVWLAGIAIVVATLVVYGNSLANPFVFDDGLAVKENPTIRQLWPPGVPLSPPANGSGVSGRPLTNLSLAINHALGGLDPYGYRWTNMAIHALATLALFGLVRRTLLLPILRDRMGGGALPLAAATALLWAVHPLQTESVDSVVQRNELLVGLFFLTTLYALARAGGDGSAARGWHVLAVAACFLGMASKEVMVTAPVMALLYDRTFLAGSFREAWVRRRWVYVGLASTWILLGWLVAGMGGTRGGAAGFGVGVITWWSYALKQCEAIAQYLRLSFWPHPLILDYGTDVVTAPFQVVWQAGGLVLLVGGTLAALWRRPVLGFAGAWFFVILAPSSSVVPLAAQTMAEHRMYLPLVAPVVLAIAGLHRLVGRPAAGIWIAVGIAFGAVTAERNTDYRTDLSIWQDTVAKRPRNERAHVWLGDALAANGRNDEALAEWERAAQLEPRYAHAAFTLGTALLKRGRIAEAIVRFEQTLLINPAHVEAHSNLGIALFEAGRTTEAVGHLRQALSIEPGSADLHYNYGTVLLKLGRMEEARTCFEAAVGLKPDHAAAHNNLGTALLRLGRLAEARSHYEKALEISPDYAEARSNLAEVGRARADSPTPR